MCDEADKCPGTPAGAKVDKVGCPLEQTLKVLFDFDKAVLKNEGKAKLDDLATKVNAINLEVVIAIGHTDSIGADAYNQKLSEQRANAEAIELLRAVGAGAYDFLCKPVDMDELTLVLQRCVYLAELEARGVAALAVSGYVAYLAATPAAMLDGMLVLMAISLVSHSG